MTRENWKTLTDRAQGDARHRLETYETHPGRWCVYDTKRRGHFMMDWGSPEEAILEARKLMIEAGKKGKLVDLIFDKDVDA